MNDPFTGTTSKFQPEMNGKNRLFPTSIVGPIESRWFWLRAAILIWAAMKWNQELFYYPPPWQFIKLEAVSAWNEHLRGGLLWLVQHL